MSAPTSLLSSNSHSRRQRCRPGSWYEFYRGSTRPPRCPDSGKFRLISPTVLPNSRMPAFRSSEITLPQNFVGDIADDKRLPEGMNDLVLGQINSSGNRSNAQGLHSSAQSAASRARRPISQFLGFKRESVRSSPLEEEMSTTASRFAAPRHRTSPLIEEKCICCVPEPCRCPRGYFR